MSEKPLFPPPGFEQLSVDEQIEYAEALSEFVFNKLDSEPVPQSHREILAERLARLKDSTEGFITLKELKAKLI